MFASKLKEPLVREIRKPSVGFAGIVGLAVAAFMLLTGAAQALGSTRYASPSGSGSACTQASPCDLETAVEVVAEDGDEVAVLPGDYNLGTSVLSVSGAIDVHGAAGQPRPRISSSATPNAVYVQNAGAVIADLAIEGSGFNALYLWRGTAERLLVIGSDRTACAPANDALLRDSVCWNVGNGVAPAAVSTASGGGEHTPQLRNVTAIATGTNSYAVQAGAASGAQVTLTGTNVIARAAGSDLFAYTDSSPGANAVIALDHSNFAHRSVEGTNASATEPASPTNQTSTPLFANAAAGDFHEAAGSPTVDAGVTSALNGSLDLGGQPRAEGASTDMGAYEFPITAPASNPPPPSNAFSFGKVKHNKKKGIAFLFVTVPGPGELSLRGKGLKTIDLAVRGGTAKLKVAAAKKGKLARKIRRALLHQGKARVTALVTYLPTGGTANTKVRKLALIEKRRG